tara:strand:- start:631 stop:1014 length:384 start_codon:yes stop_codon:yes gene_type:complete
MKEDFNLYSWKYQQLTEEIRKEIEEYIDGIVPLIKEIDFWYNNFGRLYKIKVYDENGDELTIKDDDDFRGQRRFNSDDIRYVAKQLGIQVNNDFGGRVYKPQYYEDLEQIFDNIGIKLDHDDAMDVS